MSEFHTLRTFTTKHFRVVLAWAYDDDYVNDVQDEDGNTDAETADKLASGEWTAYMFRVSVTDATGAEIGVDHLGGSIHADPVEFMDHRECGRANREHAAAGRAGRCGSYFSDMIGEAIRHAREAYNTPRAFLRAA